MATLLLSDLHLPPAASPLREGFLRFLAGPSRAAQTVYILGDLFEYWIGDDSGVKDYADEVRALKALTASGVKVFFQHGNRDFLVGRRFTRKTGVQLLKDPVVVNLEGKRVLLSHGDLFCTGDTGYQRWRRFSRNRLMQWLFLRLSTERRRSIAGGVRGRSGQHKQYKPEDIMDVTPGAIEIAMRRHHVAHLIHGHTHRPDRHTLKIDGETGSRLVLADWRPDRMEYLRADGSGLRRITL